MQKFHIHEDNSGEFAIIEARNGVSALRKAARKYPRHQSDYNVEPGEKITVTWRAGVAGERGWAATAEITVPGSSDYSCSFYES